MNPNANTFYPASKELYHIPIANLTDRQKKMFQDLILEWTTTSTLDNLFTKWEHRRQKTCSMLNIKNPLSFLLLNISSLRLYLYDLFELLNQIHVSVMILNGTRRDADTLKRLSNHLANYRIFFQTGTNAFGGVIMAVHGSIPTQQVREFEDIRNLIVLDVGNKTGKFQFATYYSPPNEKLPLDIFNDMLRRNLDTIICGDLNVLSHRSAQFIHDFLPARFKYATVVARVKLCRKTYFVS